MLKLDPSLARQFLETLFNPVYIQKSGKIFLDMRFKPDPGKEVLHRTFYPDIDALIAAMSKWNPACDYWIGVAPRKNNQKGTKQDCLCWQAIYADLDCGSAGHKKQTPYPDKDAARAALEQYPVRPSLVVDSGGGLQPYWLLHPLESNVAKVEQALKLVGGALGGDPMNGATILRLPGTFNMKIPGNPRPVTIVWCEPERVYVLGDFTPAPLVTGQLTSEVRISTEDLLPPEEERGDSAAAVYAQGGASEGERHNAAKAVVARLFAVGISEEEVLALALGWNLAQCHPPIDEKQIRGMVTWTANQERIKNLTDSLPHQPDVPAQAPLRIETDEDRSALVAALAKTLGIRLQKIVRMVGSETRFIFRVDDREIWMTTAEMLSVNSFKTKIADLSRVVIPAYKGAQWRTICQRIIDASVDEDAGPEATVGGKLEAAIAGYLEGHPVMEEVGVSQDPFFLEGRIAIYLTPLKKYLKMNCDEKISDLPQRLKSMGADYRHQTLQSKTRRFWLLPVGFNRE